MALTKFAYKVNKPNKQRTVTVGPNRTQPSFSSYDTYLLLFERF